MMIHRYSKIMHICSQVEGDLADGCDALDAHRGGAARGYAVRRA